ncbi:MAG: hypothetical protein Kow00114_32940 [Kiloniellaceae bacterium]
MGIFRRLLEQRAFARAARQIAEAARSSHHATAPADVSRETVSPRPTAVRREPTIAPVALPQSIIRERQAFVVEACDTAGAPELAADLCKLARERGLAPAAFEAEVQRRIELPRLAQAAHARIKAAGGSSLIDVEAFVARQVASGASLDAAAAELRRLEAESLAVPPADYAALYGTGTAADCRRLAYERAAAPEGSEKRRLAALLGEDKLRAEIPAAGPRDPYGEALARHEAANAAADYADNVNARGVPPSPAAAAVAPSPLGYFRCSAIPGFPHRPREGGAT